MSIYAGVNSVHIADYVEHDEEFAQENSTEIAIRSMLSIKWLTI